MNEWLCSKKTVFPKIGSGSDLAGGPSFANPNPTTSKHTHALTQSSASLHFPMNDTENSALAHNVGIKPIGPKKNNSKIRTQGLFKRSLCT